MNICRPTGWSPLPPPPIGLSLQVHVAPSLPIISHVSVKVKDCCASRISAEEKSINQSYLDKFFRYHGHAWGADAEQYL